MNKSGSVIQVILSQLSPAGSVLAGASLGEHHATDILTMSQAQSALAVQVILDFSGAESVTASYLKALFKIFTTEPDAPQQLYPMVANITNTDLRFELESYLNGKDLALREVSVANGQVTPGGMIGRLEPSADEAYQELIAIGPTTAATLHDRNPLKASNQTAWNNRLVKLFELRLAHRERVGRNWIYQSALNL
jgi:hypothetical protein